MTVIQHVSEAPWSNYSESDYTPQQWHNACLIHQHTGAPTSKSQCKLPVKTPDGVVNRNGVHAAAAALGGARTPLDATPEQKASAKSALVRYYNQFNEDLPPSLKQSSVVEKGLEFLEHHGVKGMHWGVRQNRQGTRKESVDARRVANLRRQPMHTLSNKQLKNLNERLNLEQNYNRLNPSSFHRGKALAATIIGTAGLGLTAYNMISSPGGRAAIAAGKKMFTLHRLASLGKLPV